MDHHSNTSQSQSNAIPVGIAVARQRLQEHAQQQHHAVKDLNRYGIGISSADLGEFFQQKHSYFYFLFPFHHVQEKVFFWII